VTSVHGLDTGTCNNRRQDADETALEMNIVDGSKNADVANRLDPDACRPAVVCDNKTCTKFGLILVSSRAPIQFNSLTNNWFYPSVELLHRRDLPGDRFPMLLTQRLLQFNSIQHNIDLLSSRPSSDLKYNAEVDLSIS
jgi:hypothetical protein